MQPPTFKSQRHLLVSKLAILSLPCKFLQMCCQNLNNALFLYFHLQVCSSHSKCNLFKCILKVLCVLSTPSKCVVYYVLCVVYGVWYILRQPYSHICCFTAKCGSLFHKDGSENSDGNTCLGQFNGRMPSSTLRAAVCSLCKRKCSWSVPNSWSCLKELVSIIAIRIIGMEYWIQLTHIIISLICNLHIWRRAQKTIRN